MQFLQNCFIPSKRLFQDLKFDIVYENSVSLQKIVLYVKFQRRSLLLGQMGHFTPILHHQQHRRQASFKKFCIQGTYNKQTNEMRNIWNIFFNLRVLYCIPKYVLSLWPFAYCRCPEYISSLFMFFGFKSDLMRLCNEQKTVTYTCFPKKLSVCDKSHILIQFWALQHVCLFSDF